MNKACFLDRDGVLIEERNYLSDPDEVAICAGAVEAVRRMRLHGYKVIVVSNQSGIARGYFTIQQLQAVERRIAERLGAENASLDGVYHCFHYAGGSVPEYAVDCECRKPRPGMLLQAARDFDLDLSRSLMIGDKTTDLEAGFNAGCRAGALVRSGHGREQDLSVFQGKAVVDAPDILAAADALLALTGEAGQ